MRETVALVGALAVVGIVSAMSPYPASAGEAKIMTTEQIELKLFSKAKAISPVRRTSVNLPAVTFEFNSAELTDQARTQLDQLGKALSKDAFAENKFVIGGHTDSVGEAGYNDKLSDRRANAVVEYLVSRHGVSRNALEPVGYGEQRLLPGLKPDASDHRRAEIINTGKRK